MLSIGLGILTVMYTRELHARYGHEWGPSSSSPGLLDAGIALHPSPDWSFGQWAHYILVPRSWLQLWHLWGVERVGGVSA